MTAKPKSTAPSEPVEIETVDHLQTVASQYDVVLADFYADWCGPCKMMEPILETIAAETDAGIAKVDVEKFQQLAAEYGVQGVPTLVLFADGEPVKRMVGAQTEEQLVELITEFSS